MKACCLYLSEVGTKVMLGIPIVLRTRSFEFGQ